MATKEYIERDAALEEANGLPFICLSEQECVGMQRAQAIIAKRIIALPAADVVEVVRCKDCKYCKVECGNYCCYVDDYLKMPTPHYGDFYCADGEQREVQDG